MSEEGAIAVRIIGVTAICRPAAGEKKIKGSDDQEAEELGTITDVGATEDSGIEWLQYRRHWRGGDVCVPAESFHMESGVLVSSLKRADLESCHRDAVPGLIGVSVRTHDGEDLGKIVNVLVEPDSLYALGLELSNGRIRDWAAGRPMVVIEPAEGVGERQDRHLILTAEARVAPPPPHSGLRAGPEALIIDQPPTAGLPLVRPIDWKRVRSLSEEEIRKKMAQVVWERRGCPQDGHGPDDLVDLVTPWAKQLKEAVEGGNREALDDLALISSEHVEALRVFRLGAEPLERGKPSEHPEGVPAKAGATESESDSGSKREKEPEESDRSQNQNKDRGCQIKPAAEAPESVEPGAPASETAARTRHA
ncbi:MAG TPA: hypothetical protein VFJ58_15205 [Armatimonadota bacterium]|nr:hypothetical protein [Armatimonadota bacterium]